MPLERRQDAPGQIGLAQLVRRQIDRHSADQTLRLPARQLFAGLLDDPVADAPAAAITTEARSCARSRSAPPSARMRTKISSAAAEAISAISTEAPTSGQSQSMPGCRSIAAMPR